MCINNKIQNINYYLNNKYYMFKYYFDNLKKKVSLSKCIYQN